MPHYQALLREAWKSKTIKRYQSDLIRHDKNALEDYSPGMSFAWIIRDYGTSLIKQDQICARATAQAHFSTFSTDKTARFFAWRGSGFLFEFSRAQDWLDWILVEIETAEKQGLAYIERKATCNRLFEYRLITRGAEIELILDYCKGKHNNVQWRPFSDWKKENPNRSIFWHD